MNNADWVDGKFGKALDFDGSNDYVFAPKTVGGEKAMTAAMWIKAPTLANDMPIAKMHNDKDANNKDIKTGKGWGIKIRSNGDVWFIVGSRRHRDDRTRAGAGSLKAGEWAHIAVTWDNRKATVFVNGLPKLSRTTWSGRSVGEDTEELWLGRSQRWSANDKFKDKLTTSDTTIVLSTLMRLRNWLSPIPITSPPTMVVRLRSLDLVLRHLLLSQVLPVT